MNGYPTILVKRNEDGSDGPLVNCLQRDGFHVLEADDWAQVLDAIRLHSRPIHLLLTDARISASVAILKCYRPELQVLFVSKPVDKDDVLAKVRQRLASPLGPSPFAGSWA